MELTLRRDNDRHFGVLIENYTELNCVRYTTGKLPLDTTIGDALVKIATKGAVGIPRDQVENYEFFNPDTNSPIKKQSTLSGIKNGVFFKSLN